MRVYEAALQDSTNSKNKECDSHSNPQEMDPMVLKTPHLPTFIGDTLYQLLHYPWGNSYHL